MRNRCPDLGQSCLPKWKAASRNVGCAERVLPISHLSLQGTLQASVQGKKQHFPGQPSRFKLYLQPWQLGMGKLLLFTSLICASALLAAGGQNCLTCSSLCSLFPLHRYLRLHSTSSSTVLLKPSCNTSPLLILCNILSEEGKVG